MWAPLLELTRPDDWSPHATLAATRIFASNLDPKQSQKFFKHFLLPRVRDDIQETKKLSVHLYQALKKALYKPSAFFKGILFPLCEVLQGGQFFERPVTFGTERYLHAPRSRHHRQRPLQSQHTGLALGRRALEAQ
jgi:hypothetical protein